jgi:hypothetical protein
MKSLNDIVIEAIYKIQPSLKKKKKKKFRYSLLC